MAAPSPIGNQLGELRTLGRLTQEGLAHQAGVSVDVVRRLEQGTRSSARLSTLAALADALGVPVAALLGGSVCTDDAPAAAADLAAIRRVLTTPDALPGFADFSDDTAGTPDLAALHTSTDRIWKLYQNGAYVAVGALLPDLITEARHAAREFDGDNHVAAHAVLATAYQASAGMAITLGQEDLAFIAVERAVAAAEWCGDPLHRAAAANFLSWIYRRHGRLAEAEQVATRAAERCEPRWMKAEQGEVAVFGALLLNASGAAARAKRPARARDLIATARSAAARASGDRVDRWAVFGGSVTAMTAVNNAVEYGDPDEALTLVADVPAGGEVPATWSARYLLNVAELQADARRDAAALDTLVTVRTKAPEWIRYHPQARTVTRALLNRTRRPPAELTELAHYLQLAAVPQSSRP